MDFLRRAFVEATESPQTLMVFERQAWDVYFASLVSFQMHPGNHQDPEKVELGRWADLADRMILERRRRY